MNGIIITTSKPASLWEQRTRQRILNEGENGRRTCVGTSLLGRDVITEWLIFTCQFLTSIGYSRKYLHRMDEVGISQCAYCEEEHNVSYTLIACGRFAEHRKAISSTLGGIITDSTVEVRLSIEDAWRAVAFHVHAVLRAKREERILGTPRSPA